MRRQLGKALISIAVTASVLSASGAAAQEKGVTIDPDSPAGRQYAIPFAQARQDANPGSRDTGPARSAEAVPAFGAGIPRAQAHVGGGAVRRDKSARAGARRRKRAGVTTANTAAVTGGGGAVGSLALIGLAVLIAGLVAGLIGRSLSGNRAG
jgi:hypothetical protein